LIKIITKVVSTLAVLLLLLYFGWMYVIPRLIEHESKLKDIHLVIRVIDGDTFELDNKERVRMLGIDTPEKYESSKLDADVQRNGMDKKTIQKLGELASIYTKRLIEGKKVTLIPESNYDDKDVYGRLLRYVYLEDGTFVNKNIVEEGYATAYRKYKISKLDEFITCENEAREKHTGLWGNVDGLRSFDTPDMKTNKNKSDLKTLPRKNK
jgi:micrococcal nuclease